MSNNLLFNLLFNKALNIIVIKIIVYLCKISIKISPNYNKQLLCFTFVKENFYHSKIVI